MNKKEYIEFVRTITFKMNIHLYQRDAIEKYDPQLDKLLSKVEAAGNEVMDYINSRIEK